MIDPVSAIRTWFRRIVPVPHRDLDPERIELLLRQLIASPVNGSRLVIRPLRSERVIQFRLEGLPEHGAVVSWFPLERWSGQHLEELARFLARHAHPVVRMTASGREYIRVDFGVNVEEAARFAIEALVELFGCDPRTDAVARLLDMREWLAS